MSNQIQKKPTWVWIVAGTAAVGLFAAIIFQSLRPNAGTADDSNRSTGNQSSGKTRVTSAEGPPDQTGTLRGNLAGRVTLNGLTLEITKEEVAQESMAKVGKDVLDSMLNRAIIQIACKERGVEVTAAEVDQEIVRISSEFRIAVEQYLQMLQAERGISVQQYRRDVIWPMLALKKLAGKQVAVTDEEIQEAFEREYGPRVKARMILCDNMRRAQIAWQRVKEDPENFEKYVQEFSIDPASKSLDGSIPPIPRHSGNPNLEKAAFKLKQGEVSAIIQLDDALSRYVILKCEGRTEPVVTKLDEQVQAELEEQLKKQKTQEQVAKVFDTLKKNARVDNILTGTTTAGAKPSSTGTKSTSKPSATDTNTRPIKQASSTGSATNRVRPATVSSDDDFDDLPPAKSSNATSRPKK